MEGNKLEKKKGIIRCHECSLIPLINFYVSDNGFNLILKCRNNHEYEKDLSEYLEQNLSNEFKNKNDNICPLHNNKIILICKECKKNLYEKCESSHCKTESINDFSLNKKEKEDINNNIQKYEPFIKKLRKKIKVAIGYADEPYIESLKSDIEYFIKRNDLLYELSKIIYNTYLENENNLSYEIIQNCRKCLNFNYEDLNIEGYSSSDDDSKDESEDMNFECSDFNYNQLYDYVNSNDSFILIPKEEEIDLSNIQLLNQMKFISDNNEEGFYILITELKDGRPALSTDEKVDILKNNSLDIELTITPEINVIEKARYYGLFLGDIFGMSNGNLMIVTGECIIYIYKINKKKYELIHTIKENGLIFKSIELHYNTIIAFKEHEIVQYKYIENEYKVIKEIKNNEIPEGSSHAVLKEFKDYSKILLSSGDSLIYFDMNGNIEKKLSINMFPKWDFLGNDYLLEGFGDIYIRDIDTLKEISYKQCGKDQIEVECLCSLKDGSFLCGMSNRFGCLLKQYVFKERTIKEIDVDSFQSYKEDFESIYQLKNGNIIGCISTGEYFLYINE